MLLPGAIAVDFLARNQHQMLRASEPTARDEGADGTEGRPGSKPFHELPK